jgi:hypothetical protein
MSNIYDMERGLTSVVSQQMDALKYLYGVYCEVYRTVEAENDIYNRVQLDWTYEDLPYHRGYLLVTGLHAARDVVNYWWKTDDIYLWIPKHNHFLPSSNWKINIINKDINNSFRITDKPVISGYYFIMCYKYQLVPFNEPELKDFQ